MPLKDLLVYEGRNPLPADFDEFWDERLKELDALDPAPRLVPTDAPYRSTECFDLYFTGTKGAVIYAKYLRPKNLTGKAPLLLAFHGYSGSSGMWSDYLKYTAEGFCVAALDCRGQAGKSQDVGNPNGPSYRGMFIRGIDGPAKDLTFVQQYLDLALLARIAMSFDEVDKNRVVATGGSQGGGLTLACAGLVPEVKKAAASFPFLSDYKRVWEMDLAKGAYQELSDYFRNYDPEHAREDEIFTKLGYIDVQHLAPRIKGEVLMITGLMDTICPPSTQFAAYNKITSKKSYIINPDYGHESNGASAEKAFRFLCDI